MGMDKPKTGIIFITSNWFRQVGLQDDESDLSGEVERIGRDIVERLEPFCEPVYPGVIYDPRDGEKAARKIRESGAEILLISPLMWCEDGVVRAVLKHLPDLPIILMTVFPGSALPSYLPYQEMLKGSGTVGSLQFSGMFRREGRAFVSVSGSHTDENLYDELAAHFSALHVRTLLKELRVGILPFPCDQMSTTFVDDFALRSRYGIETRYLELERVKNTAASVPRSRIDSFVSKIGELGWDIGVDERNLEEGIRYALALETIRDEEKLGVLALNDVIDEMHETFGLRPSLDNPDLSATDFTVSMEADVSAGTAMYILKHLTGSPVLYTEVLGVDITENQLLLGHAGYHDTRLADPDNPISVVPDVEYKTTDTFPGACTCFKMKPGDVTLVNSVFHTGRFSWTIVTGKSLAGPVKLEDTVHAVFAPSVGVLEFIDRTVEHGVSQHWIAVPGSRTEQILTAARWLDIDTEIIAATRQAPRG